ncbi:MAG: TIGR00266 family protein [Microcystaceae cyanobacterium]
MSTQRLDKYDIPHRIEHLPAYGSLVLTLKPNQKVLAQRSTMMGMDRGISYKSSVKEDWVKAIQKALGKNALSLEEFSTDKHKADLYLAPALPGAIQHYYVKDKRGLIVQSSSLLALSSNVLLDSEFVKDQDFFSGKSLFLLKTLGRGDVWFNGYGGIIEVSISHSHLVNTGYIIAFEESLSYQIETIRGLSLKGLAKGILGGEGKVCRFKGQGKLWLQCRTFESLANFVKPFGHQSFKKS